MNTVTGNSQMGLDLLLESLQFQEQVHAVLHPSVALTYNHYNNQVRLSNQDSDPIPIRRLQRNAVIIAERTHGLYHQETAMYLQNLAMIEHHAGQYERSLKYFVECLEIWDVLYGRDHPDYSNILVSRRPVLATRC